MDAKDLRTEPALSERNNDGSKYSQSGGIALHCDRNKSCQDIRSNSLAKVDIQNTRPCAVIGPDRVVPPHASSESFIKKAPIEPWSCIDNAYHARQPPEYPHKLPNYQNPTRNISPRQTFQENMQRIMVPTSYNSMKLNDDTKYTQISDRNNTLSKNIKLNVPPEAKFCDVPYTVYPNTNDPKNVRNPDMCLNTVNPSVTRTAPHGWPLGSVNINPARTYGAPELYQYQDYNNCAGPRPVVPRSNRNIPEESGYVYAEPYYHQEGNIRFKPYPTVKERVPHQRYDYIANYPNTFHPPPAFHPHKYDLQKSVPPHPYPPYPIKYLDRPPDTIMDGYQRTQQGGYNISYHNQMIHPNYAPVLGNGPPQNKMHSYPTEGHIKSVHPNKTYDYDNGRPKLYPPPENYLLNEMGRMQSMKSQVIMPNYSTLNIHNIPLNTFYKKDNQHLKSYEAVPPHFRNIDPNLNMHSSIIRHAPVYSPTTLAISPTDSSASNDTSHMLGSSQEDCGYVSQSSTASVRSIDSGINRIPNEFLRRYYDSRFGTINRSSTMMSKSELNAKNNSKEKKNLNVRQFLQMWNEGDEETEVNNAREKLVPGGMNNEKFSKIHEGIIQSNQEQLYVLGLVNVPSEELDKYEHIQKVSKLPENIKGYNHIELLNQFEEAIESSNLSNYKPPPTKQYQMPLKGVPIKQAISSMPPRPLSPLDVEAKISQSIIHKEVGCNFEIKPCSPKMLNVEVATPVQNILAERSIEKVANPVILKSPRLKSIGNNINCDRNDSRLTINNDSVRIPSCKMVNTHFSNQNNIDAIKNSYSLHDLESSSGLCLASLPRLDNDIELNFPEVNQQFINANKAEPASLASSIRDLPTLEELDQAGNETQEKLNDMCVLTPEKDVMKSSCIVDSEKEGKEISKLSKYRKNKTHLSELKENLNAARTDSVIIKNPENYRNYEENMLSPNCIKQSSEVQQNPINLTSQEFVTDNADNVSLKIATPHEKQEKDLSIDIAIDFSVSKTNCNTDFDCKAIESPTPNTINRNDTMLDGQSSEVPLFSGCDHNDVSNLIRNIGNKKNNTMEIQDLATITENGYLSSIPREDTCLKSTSKENDSLIPENCLKEANNINTNSVFPVASMTSTTSSETLCNDNVVKKHEPVSEKELNNATDSGNPHTITKCNKNHTNIGNLRETVSNLGIDKPKESDLNDNAHNTTIGHPLNINCSESLVNLPGQNTDTEDAQNINYPDLKLTGDSKSVGQTTVVEDCHNINCFDLKSTDNHTEQTLLTKDVQNISCSNLNWTDNQNCNQRTTTTENAQFDLKVTDNYKAAEETTVFDDSLNINCSHLKIENDGEQIFKFTEEHNHTKGTTQIKELKLLKEPNHMQQTTDIKDPDNANLPHLKLSDKEILDKKPNTLSLTRSDDIMNNQGDSQPTARLETVYTLNRISMSSSDDIMDSQDNYQSTARSGTVYISNSLSQIKSAMPSSQYTDKLNAAQTADTSFELTSTSKIIPSLDKSQEESIMKASTLNLNSSSPIELHKDDISKAILSHDEGVTQVSNDPTTALQNESDSDMPSPGAIETHSDNNDACVRDFNMDTSIINNATTCSLNNQQSSQVTIEDTNVDVHLVKSSATNISTLCSNDNIFETCETETNQAADLSGTETKHFEDNLTQTAEATLDLTYATMSNVEENAVVTYVQRELRYLSHNSKEMRSPQIQNLLTFFEGTINTQKVPHNEAICKDDAVTNMKTIEQMQISCDCNDLENDSKEINRKVDGINDYIFSTIEEKNTEPNNLLISDHYSNNDINEIDKVTTNPLLSDETASSKVAFSNKNEVCPSKYIPSGEECKSTSINRASSAIQDETTYDMTSNYDEMETDNILEEVTECGSPSVLQTQSSEFSDCQDGVSNHCDKQSNMNEKIPETTEDNTTISSDETNELLRNPDKFTSCNNEVKNAINMIPQNNVIEEADKTICDVGISTPFEKQITCILKEVMFNKEFKSNVDVTNKDEILNKIDEKMAQKSKFRDDLPKKFVVPEAGLPFNNDSDQWNKKYSELAEHIDIGSNRKHEIVELWDKQQSVDEISQETDTKFKYNSDFSDILDTQSTFAKKCIEQDKDHLNRNEEIPEYWNKEFLIPGQSNKQPHFSEKILQQYEKQYNCDENEQTSSHTGIEAMTPSRIPIEYNLENRKRQSLKRSLSDSALNILNSNGHSCEDHESFLWPFKRKKTENVDNVFAQNLCSIIQSNRRNSVSSFYNEENVSFCIYIDNNCIIADGESDEHKLCYTELSEECLSRNQNDCVNHEEDSEATTEIITTSQQENDCEYSDSYLIQSEDDKQTEWVDDVGCVETIIDDDIAENVEISGPSSPKFDALSENDESGVFSSSEHTDKVKFIYGDKMCNDDAQLVEILYNTPQMDVNKTLVRRESLITTEYYDNDSLEKILSDSNDQKLSPYLTDYKAPLVSPDALDVKELQQMKDVEIESVSSWQNQRVSLDVVNETLNQIDIPNNMPLGQAFNEDQSDMVYSCESSVDNVFTCYGNDESTNDITSSSPEVSSTTSEEKNSGILLKITNYKGSRVSQINDINRERMLPRCKFTEENDYIQSHVNFPTHRPLITKAAQKYIPPLKESMRDLTVKLSLPPHSLIKLKQLKKSKEEPKVYKQNISVPRTSKKPKPKFEDVLKSIDEIQFKMHKDKAKKSKKSIPKVVIKKNENGSHYASTSSRADFNPDLTGRKWQPWVFIEKNNFIDKMATKRQLKAIYSHRKKMYVLAEKFRKYKSINNAKFIIAPPASDCPATGLKYTIRLKHDY